MKVCTRCGTAKRREHFYARGSWCRPCTRAYSKDYRARFPERRRANKLVEVALRNGRVRRPTLCERCGQRMDTVAHHEDYAQPLAIQWLCDRCHILRHVELGRHAPRRRKP